MTYGDRLVSHVVLDSYRLFPSRFMVRDRQIRGVANKVVVEGDTNIAGRNEMECTMIVMYRYTSRNIV